MPTGPLERVELTITQYTTEDWYMALPVNMPEGHDLTGVTARCVLQDGASKIEFEWGTELIIEDMDIIMDKDADQFRNKVGTYTGEILLTFPEDYDVVSHVITATIKRGTT